MLFGIDATNLNNHPILKTELFDKIVFNFPHVGGKMRIEKNRELLKQFFMSSARSLKSNGSVLVTLCNGQGGTPFDNPPRRWDDSWKVTEMAAHGDFVLNTVESFVQSLFPNYIVTGYRGLNKSFHSTGALTYTFVQSKSPTAENIAPENKINASEWNNDSLSWKEITRSNVPNENTFNSYAHTYTFDITFSTDEKFNPVELYILLYNYAGRIIEDINLVRVYKSPSQKAENRTYRISYKSDRLPLHRKRVIDIHQNLIASILEDKLKVLVSR